MAACIGRILLRKNNMSKLSFINYYVRNSTALLFKKLYYPSSCIISSRCYSSENPRNDQENEDGKDNKTGTFGTVITQGPLGWLSKKIHMVLLKAYFDPEFDEKEFIRGAKQALVVTSEIIAEKRFEDMDKICPSKLIDVIKDAMKTQDLGPAVKAVDIMMANIKQIQLGYTEEQKKQVEIVVTFACHPKDLGPVQQEIGNIKIIYVRQPRIIEYCFRKLCVPDKDSWLVVGINL